MQYRQFGTTGIRISEISFGCGNTAGVMISGSQRERYALIGRALEQGINHFDTAPSYGEGVSERNLGAALHALGARPSVATKVEFDVPALADIPGTIRRSIDASLERLRLDQVDIVYLHNRISMQRQVRDGVHASNLSVDDVLGPGGVVEAMEQIRQAGKVHFFGLCTPGGEPAAVRRVIDSGRFHCVQLTYNLLNPTESRPPPAGFTGPDYGQIMDYAAAQGLGAAVIRPLAAGALVAGDAPHHHMRAANPRTAAEFLRDAANAKTLRFLERGGERTMAQAGIRFILANPRTSTAVVGISSLDQLDQAVSALHVPPLTADELAQIDDLYQTDFGRLPA